jgi:DNA polymerase delta subunit 4
MPPGRRKSGNPSVSSRNAAAQSTLSFNSKSARVTKPSAADASTKKVSSKISEAELGEAVDNVHSEDLNLEPEVAEVPIRQQAKPVAVKDEAEEKAEKISDPQLKRYWKAEEDKRKAPRGTYRCIQDYLAGRGIFAASLKLILLLLSVHQEHLSMNEKILRHFDLSSQYGPCIGIPRLRRWKRAYGLGLNPPLEVLAVLLREQKTNKGKGEMAYIDELAGGRVMLIE